MSLETPGEEPKSSRRDFVSQAAAATTGLFVGAMLSTPAAAEGGGSLPPEDPTLKKSKQTHRFQLSKLKPQVITNGGSVAISDRDNFPIVKDQLAAVYLLRLVPGGVREPHWHPNCWEVDYVVKGKCRLGVVNPDDTYDEVILEAGDIGFIPMGYAHYIECVGDEECEVTVTFNHDKPQDFGLSTTFAGMPTRTFAATFGVPESSFQGFRKPNHTLYVVSEKKD